MWRHFLKDYFNFTKKERRGIIWLVSAMLMVTLASFFYPYFIKEETIDQSEFKKEIARLRIDSTKNFDKKSSDEYYNDYSLPYKKYPSKTEVFYFDPNTASENDWVRLGVKEKTAQTIQKYISKGGKFYKAEDLKKIWGLRPADIARLLPYVNIQSVQKISPQLTTGSFPKKEYFPAKKIIQKVDVNLADTSQYISLPGIGSKLSQRIIAFRERLGGFYSIEQVAETYFLPDSTFQKIKPYLVINNHLVKQININEASIDEMKSHPYIKYNLANAIFQYRRQHGNFNSVDDVKKIMLVTDDVFNKVVPYLTIQ